MSTGRKVARKQEEERAKGKGDGSEGTSAGHIGKTHERRRLK